ncbi:MAG: hypothetical protein AAF065_15330 [Verrucomicrobiota bacterium]
MKPYKPVIPLVCLIAAVAVSALWWSLGSRGGDEQPSSETGTAAVSAGKTAAVGPGDAPVANPEQDLTIREAVLILSGRQGEGSYAVRIAAAHALPEDLTPVELGIVRESILLGAQPEGLGYRQWHALFNDTLNALVLEQSRPVAQLPELLRTIIAEGERDPVIRDYALQHLLAFAEHRMGPQERLALLEALWPGLAGSADQAQTLPGTYLLALTHAQGQAGWPGKETTAARAWEVLQNEQTHVLTRITALQICGKLGYPGALPLSREIAGGRDAHMTLRTAAIATIGDLGGASELDFLNDLHSRTPARLRVAIEAARTRIDSRLPKT